MDFIVANRLKEQINTHWVKGKNSRIKKWINGKKYVDEMRLRHDTIY